MENFIIYILTSHLLWLSIFIVSFFIPIIIVLIRRNKRKTKKGILNKDSIIIDSEISGNIFLIYFLLFFVFIGFILTYLALTKGEILSNKVIGSIFGVMMILIPIIFIVKNLKEYIRVKEGNYIIVLDELSDKFYYSDKNRDIDDIDRSEWQLFFKNYFKKYNKYVPLKEFKLGDKYNIGDEFYLVFVKGKNIPYIYPLKEYNLDESEKKKLDTYENIQKFINIKEFKLNSDNNLEKSLINKQKIINDFNKEGHKKTAIINILVCLFIIVLFLATINLNNVLASIIIFLFFLFWLFFTIIKIKYVYIITKNVKHDNFEIKIDIVESLNNQVGFKDSNTIISFKFKKYKKIVFADKEDYNKTNIGDEFYLIFVKGENEPIKVYRVKDSILSDDIKKKFM